MKSATITLTEQEEALCQLLDHTCNYINTARPHIPEIDSTQFSGDGTEPCEARIAGGWVRDKLLDRESDDLDISLSTLTGNAFALYLKHYLSSSSFASSPLASSHYFQNDKSDMGRIGKIAANPEQSKNLETATARVLGLSLDFVNLRKETYDPGSRIPKMQFGTPKEDAERRDITINSLLYNVHTRQVEDHTGMGLTDLAAGLIRTPLPPLTTFLDDPLRVLRCIRFASRFNYELHPSIIRCLTGHSVPGSSDKDKDEELDQLASSDDPRISAGQQGIEAGREELRNALLTKVSRERFGIEVDKMLKGPNPLLALFLIHHLGLFSLIFHPPPSSGPLFGQDTDPKEVAYPQSTFYALNAARLLDAFLKQSPLRGSPPHPVAMDTLSLDSTQSDSQLEKQITRAFSARPSSPIPSQILDELPKDLLSAWSNFSPEEERRLWFAVALFPLQDLVYEEKKNKFAWAGESVIANGLKLGTKTLKDPVASLFKSRPLLDCGVNLTDQDNDFEMRHFYSHVLEEGLHLPSGLCIWSQLVMLLRNSNVTNSALQIRPESALLITFIHEILSIWTSLEPCGDLLYEWDTDQTSVKQSAFNFDWFWNVLHRNNMIARAEEKPLLDGNSLTTILNCHPRLIPLIQIHVLSWQLDHPAASTCEEQSLLEHECSEWLEDEWDTGGIVPPDQRLPPPPASKGDKTKKKGAATSSNAATHNVQDHRKRQKSE